MPRSGLLALALLSIGTPVQCQTSEHLKLPTLIFAGAAAADWASTYRNLAPYGHEANPLLQPFHDQPVPTVIAGAALDVAAVWTWNRFIGRRHPKMAALGLYAAAGFRVWMAARNVQRWEQRPVVAICPPLTFCR